MPKKAMGYTPTGKIKDSPVTKQAVPFKTPTIKTPELDNKIAGTKALAQPLAGGPNMVAKLGKPQKFSARKPSTKGM